MSAPDRPLIIVGGGLAGCLAALAVRACSPGQPLLLVEEGASFGGNHIWSFFDSDVRAEDRWLIDPAIIARWPDHDVRFPKRRRRIPTGYNSVSSEALDRHVRDTLDPSQWRLSTAVEAVDAGGITLANGKRIEGGCVIDARGARSLATLDNGWQKFVGRIYEFGAPHGVERPLVMDATVEQADGYRFVYLLPFTPTRMLVEDTYYSINPGLDREMLGERIETYIAASGFPAGRLVQEETGVLPVTMAGDFDALWPAADNDVGRIGMRGGLYHPTTGYSLPDAVRTALFIADNTELDSRALAHKLRARSRKLWKQRAFYRLLNRLLFRAARPGERYRVLEHFYRLDPARIERFYAGQATAWDKVRILSGRPPVPVRAALSVLAGSR